MASSDIYRELLLHKRHGLPLWKPDPDANLPEANKKRGISIGDLGLLTNDGGFDYLCNIHADADDPVNQHLGTPLFFTPIPHNPVTDTVKTTLFHPERTCVTHGAKYKIDNTLGVGAQVPPGINVGDAVNYTINKERAAMLFLPHGADRDEAKAYGEYTDYIIEYGELWYKYLNVDRRREARNGSLYLVTGCDKGHSWGLAAGSPEEKSEVKFSIGAGLPGAVALPASGSMGFHMSCHNTAGVESRYYPTSTTDINKHKNQCVFIRGFVIGINESWLRKWRGTASFQAFGNNIPFGTSGRNPALSWLRKKWRGTAVHSTPITSSSKSFQAFGVIVRKYPEYPDPVLSPGSYICEHILSSRPNINLVIVHDHDWMTATSSNDEDVFSSDGTDYERLMTRVLEKSQLITKGKTAILNTA